jgi:hypothetical protein
MIEERRERRLDLVLWGEVPFHRPKNATPARSNLLGRESDIENALQRMDQLKLADTMFAPPSPGAPPMKRIRKMGDIIPY